MYPPPPPSKDYPRSNPARPENRAWPRYPGRFKTYCQSINEGDELLWSVQIRDFSAQGLKIVSHRRFEPGTILRIGLIHEKAAPIVAQAIHVTPTTEGDWLIGCVLPEKLEDNELKDWLKEKP